MGSSLCRIDAHSHKGSGATVGYHDYGHPNQGTKIALKNEHMLGSRAHEGLQPHFNMEERKGLKEAQHAAHPHPLGPAE